MDELYSALLSNNGGEWEFCRDDVEDFSLFGFPVMFNEDIVVLNYVYDFALDGYKVIRTKDITAYDHASDACKFRNNIYLNENICPKMPKGIKEFESLKDLLSQLSQLDIVCSVECEWGEDTFAIGKICEVKEDCIEMICFDPLCKLDEEPTRICIDDITTVSFGNRYSDVMGKYVNWN